MRGCGALLALALVTGTAGMAQAHEDAAPELPVIQSIDFAGNDITQPKVMLREMVVKPGDPADPARVERSRQGIQDLGLFKSVAVRETPVPGGVALTFVVEERWYILPIPRLDANSEGESAYGMTLRWFNFAGLNHTIRGNYTRRDEEKANKGESISYGVGYSMPFVADTPWGIGMSVGHSETPITDFGGYTESVDSAGISLTRSFASGPASQGWNAGVSLTWSDQRTEGLGAPEAQGTAALLGLWGGYRDVRYAIYSEEGIVWSAGVAGANEGLLSDYSIGSARIGVTRYLRIGERAHQSVHAFAAAATQHGGPTGYRSVGGAYGLGGASLLRAYPADFVTGDFYYLVGAEYLRPIVWDWLRGVIVLEAGNAWAEASSSDSRVYASLGFGLRVRATFLVNFEVEAGVAIPLDEGGQRFFASKV
ncbi:MAG TPA: POTRA domain-containing protein [Verrucomicrobiae bacterium]|nr:POTRA domain-containing protein [Verrucomicrobiae bacterium]